jgi:hypothetical protein
MRYTRLVEDRSVFTDEHHANVYSGFLSLSIIFIVTAAGQRSRKRFAHSLSLIAQQSYKNKRTVLSRSVHGAVPDSDM